MQKNILKKYSVSETDKKQKEKSNMNRNPYFLFVVCISNLAFVLTIYRLTLFKTNPTVSLCKSISFAALLSLWDFETFNSSVGSIIFFWSITQIWWYFVDKDFLVNVAFFSSFLNQIFSIRSQAQYELLPLCPIVAHLVNHFQPKHWILPGPQE